MRRIAYLRVSTAEQRPDRQLDGLRGLADELHIETLSAAARHRPIFERVVNSLGPGDALVVWSIDRAFRSARDALNQLHALQSRGVQFHIADLKLDTTSPHGKLMFTLMSGVFEFERDFLIQRTKEGIEAARRRGKRIGRPPKLSPTQLGDARVRLAASSDTQASIAAELGVTSWTLARALKRASKVDSCSIPRGSPSRDDHASL